MQLHGALINGLETRVSGIESQLSDLDARGSEEHDNLANERELHRFILTGELGVLDLRYFYLRTVSRCWQCSFNDNLDN